MCYGNGAGRKCPKAFEQTVHTILGDPQENRSLGHWGLIKMADISIEEARLRMIQKRFGGNAAGANVGGMRKNKGTHKSVGGEHKRVGGLA